MAPSHDPATLSPARKNEDAEPSLLVPTPAKGCTEQILADVPLRGRGYRNLPRYTGEPCDSVWRYLGRSSPDAIASFQIVLSTGLSPAVVIR